MRGPAAAGDDAAPVSDGEGAELGGGGGADLAAHVEDVGAVGDHPAGDGVAGEELDGGGSDDPTVTDLAPSGSLPIQGLVVDDHTEMRLLPTGDGGFPGVEVVAADLGDGIDPPLSRGPSIAAVAVGRTGERPDGGDDHLTRNRIQVAFERDHPIERIGDRQPAPLEPVPLLGGGDRRGHPVAPHLHRGGEIPGLEPASLAHQHRLGGDETLRGRLPGPDQPPHPHHPDITGSERRRGLRHPPNARATRTRPAAPRYESPARYATYPAADKYPYRRKHPRRSISANTAALPASRRSTSRRPHS